MQAKFAKTVIAIATVAAAAIAGQAAAAPTGSVPADRYGYELRTGKFDPYSEGARTGKFDVYSEGARAGKFDPFTEGARVGKTDPFTDSFRSAGLDRTGVSASPSRRFDDCLASSTKQPRLAQSIQPWVARPSSCRKRTGRSKQ
jgi:hypothetical protein